MTDSATPRDPGAALRGLLQGAMVTRVVGVAAEIGLADTLAARATVAEVAAAHDMAPGSARRLLRAFASLGCADEPEPDVFVRTDVGALLDSTDPGSMLSVTKLCAGPLTIQPWLLLETSLRTGGPVFEDAFGSSLFAYYDSEPASSRTFNAAMSELTRDHAAALVRQYDFDRPGTIADLGGGDGTLLAALLRAAPRADGVLVDVEAGSATAARVLAEAGVADRCTVRTGDFRESVPDADLYMIKSVLHNWDDEDATTVLRHCRDGLRPGGRVLMIDPVLPDRPETDPPPFNPYLADLHMLVVAGGRERTRADLGRLCADAGLAIEEIVDLAGTELQLVTVVPR